MTLPSAQTNLRNSFAFTLVEILVVIAILVMLVALMIPAIQGISGSMGRNGAICQLMNAFEQARVAALESGKPVYVVLGGGNNTESDAFVMVRERMDSEPTSPAFVYLTGWKRLPSKILFQEGSLLNAESKPSDFPDSLPQITQFSYLGAVKINASGFIEFPVVSPLELTIGEGIRLADKNPQMINPSNRDTLVLSRLTGRIALKAPL